MALNLSGTSGITGAGIGTIGPSGANVTGVVTCTSVVSSGAVSGTTGTFTSNVAVTGVSTFTGDVSFAGASYNAMWDKSKNALVLNDNTQLNFGTNEDGDIYHDDDNMIINNAKGKLMVRSASINIAGTSNQKHIVSNTGVGVTLFYNNSARFETTLEGTKTTGVTTVTESGTGNGMGCISAATVSGGGNAGYGFKTNDANRFAVTTIGSAGAESLRVYDDNNNAERLRVDPSGRVLLNTTTEGNESADDLTISSISGSGGITIRTGDSSNGNVFFSDNTSGAGEYSGFVQYAHTSDELILGANTDSIVKIHDEHFNIYAKEGTLRMNFGFTNALGGELSLYDDTGSQKTRITGSTDTNHFFNNGGNVLINSTSSAGTGYAFESYSSGAYNILAKSTDGNGGYHNFTGQGSTGTITSYITHNGRGYFEDGVQFDTNGESLDSYEEGTWTPTIAFGGGTTGITYNHQSGSTYTKIGRMVHIRSYIMLSSKGSDTGNLTMHGLPFNSSNLSGGYTVLASWHTSMEIPGYKNIQCYIDTNSTTIRVHYYNESNGDASNVTNTMVNNNTEIMIAGSYVTSA